MKTLQTLLTLCLFMMFTLFTQAQGSFGVRVGANLADIDFEIDGASLDTKSKFGFDIAAVYNLPITDALALQPEIHYAQAGFEIEDDDEFEIGYIQVPILVQYDLLSSNESIDLSPFAGPYVGIGISGDPEFEDDVKRLDFGFQAGVMLRFESGFFADVRYGFGLSDVDDSGADGSAKNRILGFGVGYFF